MEIADDLLVNAGIESDLQENIWEIALKKRSMSLLNKQKHSNIIHREGKEETEIYSRIERAIKRKEI